MCAVATDSGLHLQSYHFPPVFPISSQSTNLVMVVTQHYHYCAHICTHTCKWLATMGGGGSWVWQG